MNCSEYLVDFLIKKGITDVFGYAGGYIVPFMDALYKRRDEITTHVCYNEQGCALAADGFARTSGKLGVYFTTSGPGAVNGLSGLADCWFAGFPDNGHLRQRSNTRDEGFLGNPPERFPGDGPRLNDKERIQVFSYCKQRGILPRDRFKSLQHGFTRKERRGCN